VIAAAEFVQVEKIYKSGPFARSGVTAVKGVSLAIPTGCVFGLLGPNRAGKTTLVKLLLSLARPTAGTVTRLGRPIRERATLARIGYMHENHAFPRYLSAKEVLHFYGGLAGVPTDKLKTKATELLERVGLTDRGREPITQFSKGMVQRLGLAQALMNDPDLLILDEPTEGLDLSGRQLLRDVVSAHKKTGKTVLLVSHVLPEVQELCDQLAVIVGGSMVHRGSMADLVADHKPLEHALRGLYQKGAAG